MAGSSQPAHALGPPSRAFFTHRLLYLPHIQRIHYAIAAWLYHQNQRCWIHSDGNAFQQLPRNLPSHSDAFNARLPDADAQPHAAFSKRSTTLELPARRCLPVFPCAAGPGGPAGRARPRAHAQRPSAPSGRCAPAGRRCVGKHAVTYSIRTQHNTFNNKQAVAMHSQQAGRALGCTLSIAKLPKNAANLHAQDCIYLSHVSNEIRMSVTAIERWRPITVATRHCHTFAIASQGRFKRCPIHDIQHVSQHFFHNEATISKLGPRSSSTATKEKGAPCCL